MNDKKISLLLHLLIGEDDWITYALEEGRNTAYIIELMKEEGVTKAEISILRGEEEDNTKKILTILDIIALIILFEAVLSYFLPRTKIWLCKKIYGDGNILGQRIVYAFG